MNTFHTLPQVTIVMYHYVRDTMETPFPAIHARSLMEFERQLDHIAGQYEVIPLSRYARFLRGLEDGLPAQCCILTFDEGFKDHIKHVLPSLQKRGFTAAFFPITETVTEKRVATVQKGHFLMARLGPHRFSEALEEKLALLHLPSVDTVTTAKPTALPYRFDDPDTLKLKNRIAGLPLLARREALDALFRKFITKDESAFSEELYLSERDIQIMQQSGMEFGVHTHTHPRLSLLPIERQKEEIERAQGILARILGQTPSTFSYPYGDYNDATIKILNDLGMDLALTTKVGVEKEHADRFQIKRVNTNDLPH